MYLVFETGDGDGYSDAELHKLTAIDPWFLAQMRDLHDTEEWLRKQEPGGHQGQRLAAGEEARFSDPQIAAALGLAQPSGAGALEVRRARTALGVVPSFRRVDTCAAEFAADTPYMYSCYDGNCESAPTTNKKGKEKRKRSFFFRFVLRERERETRKRSKLSQNFPFLFFFSLTHPPLSLSLSPFPPSPRTNQPTVLILGGGPNRIGQGIEFDYCCCHASFSLRDKGFETIMMNSNPETVSTDYDTSSRLYFEPLTGESRRGKREEVEREEERRKKRKNETQKIGTQHLFSLFPFLSSLSPPHPHQTVEDVLNVVEKCRPDGIIVQFGGQTPLKLATPLAEYLKANPIPAASGDGLVKIWGTQPESIDAAEDRDLWYELLQKLQIKQPPGTMVSSEEAALKAADSLGYPVMVRRERERDFFFLFGFFLKKLLARVCARVLLKVFSCFLLFFFKRWRGSASAGAFDCSLFLSLFLSLSFSLSLRERGRMSKKEREREKRKTITPFSSSFSQNKKKNPQKSGPPLVRARRPRHGDRLLGQGPVALHPQRRRGGPGQARAGRQGKESFFVFFAFFFF